MRTFCTVSRRPGRAARAANSARSPLLPLAFPQRRRKTPVGWRERRETFGPSLTGSSYQALSHQGVHAPAVELSKAGQNPSRPSVTAGQPRLSSCLVEVHAKTTLTEPARPRKSQRSGAWTRAARTVDA